MAVKTVEARAVVSAADQTGGIFDKLAQKIKGVSKEAKALEGIKPPKFTGDLMEELKRLKLSEKELQDVRQRQAQYMEALRRERPRASQFFRAQSEWQDREVNHWRNLKSKIDEAAVSHKRWRSVVAAGAGSAMIRGAALAGGVYGAMRVGKAGIKAAAENQRENARDYTAGLSPEESSRLETEALHASRRWKSVDSNTMHERLRDTAMSMRDTDKAIGLSDTIGQMTTVLASLKGKDKAVEEGRKFFAALDVLGKNVDPKDVKELADGFVKALGVEGADMDLGGVLQFAKQSRAAGGLLSNRFLMQTMPGLARDMGDAQLGTSLASALGQNVGNRATKESMAAQRAMGLRDEKGFKNAMLAMSDPDRYAWDVLMPAMQKRGIDTTNDLAVVKELTKLFSNRTVQDVFGKLINQKAQYQGKQEQYARAPGLDAAATLMGKDPFVAYESLFASLRTLSAQAGPLLAKTIPAINSLADAMGNISKTLETGEVPADTRGGRAIAAVDDWNRRRNDTDGWLEKQRVSGLRANKAEIDNKLETWGDLTEEQRAKLRMNSFDAQMKIQQSELFAGQGAFGLTQEEIDRQQELMRERNRGQYGTSAGYTGRGDKIPTPDADPRKTFTAMPPVQPLEGAEQRVTVEGDVKGQVAVEQKFVVDSSGLVSFVSKVERLLVEIQGKMRQVGGNGPGSSGRSSPDADLTR